MASTLAVVGLGYVGLPLAAAFSKHFRVIGCDINETKIAEYRAGHDATEELGDAELQAAKIEFTSDAARLAEADFIVVAVPTPVHGDKTPDLEPVKGASRLVGKNMRKGTVVVYESTVYPGVTEEICRPILETSSGLACGRDFAIGYSPERINPGDREHRLKNIRKIVSGMDEATLNEIAEVYGKIIEAGVYRAPSIKVAEAAKLVENAQRDINIAFMNELAMAFNRMDIDTNEVVKAMDTKWNALGFRPGLVGGHCIGVDPYYFIYQAELLGYHSQIIAAGRRVNDSMSEFVAGEIVRAMLQNGVDACRARVYLLGMTFKEDCPDTRNSRPVDVYHALRGYGIHPIAVDPIADKEDFQREYGISLHDTSEIKDADCLVFLVRHRAFREWGAADLPKFFRRPASGAKCVVIDVKSIFPRNEIEAAGYAYWNL